jgi:hypothetical protein
MLATLGFVSDPALTKSQGDRVLAALARRRDEAHGGNVLALSRELKKSQSALWQLFEGRTRPSYKMAVALAGAMGCSVESLLASPRERAAELAREIGVSEGAIQRVLREPDDGSPRATLHYVDLMRAFDGFAPGAAVKKAS